MLFVILASLAAALLAPSVFYYQWMKTKAGKDWDLVIDSGYQPEVSLIVATYNEGAVIHDKLKNIQETDYPEGKLQVIVVDSASTDDTLARCKSFLEENNLRFPVELIAEKERLGKSHALNAALEHAEGEIIATSDADSFWEPSALRKAVSFLADSSVGAVTGREELINLGKSVHTLSEGVYRKFYYTLRLGESKVHSTLIFQGEMSLYRRSAFERFEDRAGYSDDTGTVIDIVSKGHRCIFVPDAVFHDTAAFSLTGRLMLKTRRAQHLVAGMMHSARLKIGGRLALPSEIVFFNFYMHVVSPLLLVAAAIVFAILAVLHFPVFLFAILLLVPLFAIKRSRLFLISYVTSNLALILGLAYNLAGKRNRTWRRIEEMRAK